MRVVVDTNVVVSRFLSPYGPPAKVFELWESQLFQLVVSEPILDEYRRALLYEHVARRHGLNPQEVAQVVETIVRLAAFLRPEVSLAIIQADPSDDKFLECALAGEADYLVSGDDHLLALKHHRGVEILSPAAFVAAVGRSGETTLG